MNQLLGTYGPNGYYWILVWGDSLATMQSYFDTHGFDATNCYSDPSWAALSQYAAAYGGGSGGIPQTGLVDRDGDVRKYKVGQIDYTPDGATEWENAVKELVGVS
jgi:hypothetical protein